MMNSNNTISEIAVEFGFADSSHFTKFFKQQTGANQKISLTNIARYLFTSREALSRARIMVTKQLGGQNQYGSPI